MVALLRADTPSSHVMATAVMALIFVPLLGIRIKGQVLIGSSDVLILVAAGLWLGTGLWDTAFVTTVGMTALVAGDVLITGQARPLSMATPNCAGVRQQ